MSSALAKRCFDIGFSLLAIVLLLPLILLAMIGIFFLLGSPIHFVQDRPGKDGQSFRIIKFRSMNNAVGVDKQLLPDAQRLTRFGRFLRATSLDELPELYNVLIGDMSLVGPRPLLMEYLPLYNEEQARRHSVRPGITGWAQINGRNAQSWDERFALDLWYVDNRSFWLDLKILWLTVKKVIRREGISHEGEATMPKFTGNMQ